MSIRNNVQLIGHVGMNPEIKNLQNGGKLARLSLATNENYKNKTGEWIENTMWHQLTAWDQIADRLENSVSKGTMVLVEGKLVNRQYQDKENNTRYITEIEIKNFMVLDGKKTNDITLSAQKQTIDADGYEDLPF